METKKTFAENFSDKIRKKYRMLATGSALTGCISEWFIDSNTLIILYLVMLGGSESFSMFSSAISALVSVLLVIPCAGVANRIGLRISYSSAVYLGMFAYFLMAAAPFFGEIAKYIVMLGCFLYCLSRPLYGATWYPMCDAFLLKSERGSFFGNMRFTYMTLNAILIFVAGKFMGAKPPIWVMQLIVLFPGIMLLGRKICMDNLPVNPASEKNAYDLRKALAISIRNSELMGFAFYICMVNMSIAAALPLAILYMKTTLDFNASQIMTITSIGLLGYISGYALVGKLMKKLGTRNFQLLTHGIFILFLGSLFLIQPQWNYLFARFAVLFYVHGIAAAFLMCLTSTEMLALARPTNKLMASAMVTTFQNIGTTIGRIGTSVILGLCILTDSWTLQGGNFTKYNTLFGLSLCMILFSLFFLLLSPSFVPKHKDYYEPSN
ncbi:MAG: MFS transporter [Lentisphaeria bacterium]|nr:MFS transporter [Lentisphaeria bacterium]